jgi:hypothetical protein
MEVFESGPGERDWEPIVRAIGIGLSEHVTAARRVLLRLDYPLARCAAASAPEFEAVRSLTYSFAVEVDGGLRRLGGKRSER